ncbi:MAG TPA: response regulator [Verrucomicrobiae bacterium]
MNTSAPNAFSQTSHSDHLAADALPRVLCVDDDPSICRAMGKALARNGYLVVIAGDGRTAWNLLQTESFDLLITDQDMPGLTGRELITTLRQKGYALPVIVASGHGETYEPHHLTQLSIHTILHKPFSLHDLIQTVHTSLA